jgi:citrate lyase beta subunit
LDEDLRTTWGHAHSRRWEVFYAVVHVTYTPLPFQAIDQVFVDFNNTEGLIRDARQGVTMGFSGKQIIHPKQVHPVQEVFTPSDEAIARAIAIVEASESNLEAGKGAFALDGRMIDAPIIKSAQRVLEKARAAGKI